jgi:hypothetical protein
MLFEGSHLSLELDDQTGNLVGILARAEERWLFRASSIDTVHLSVNGTVAPNALPDPVTTTRPQDWFWVPMALPREEPVPADPSPTPFTFVSTETADIGDADEVRVRQRSGPWEVTQIYCLDHGRPIVEIGLEVSFHGDGEQRLNYVAWRTGGWALAEPADDPIAAMGRPVQEVALADGGVIGLWRTGEAEHHEWEVRRSPDAAGVIGGWIYAGGRVHAGSRLHVGSIVLGWSAGTAVDLARDVAAWYTLHDIRGLPGRPRWADDAHLYETFIGSWPMHGTGQEYAPYATTEALAADLDRIQGLGFDTIYLMPRHPYPSYSTVALEDPGRQYGDGPDSDDRFRALVDAVHARGMRIIVDIVLHGVIDLEAVDLQAERRDALERSGGPVPKWRPLWHTYERAHEEAWRQNAPAVHHYYLEHPEWFSTMPDGSAQFTYSRSFDLRHPGLRTFFIERLTELVQDWHIDGFRFDAPWWAYYNYRWTEDAGYRASWVVGGAIELIKEAFSAISPDHPETLFFVEGFDPMLLRSAHLQYPYDEWDALKALWAGEKTAAEARMILAWLGRVRTPGVGVVHWVDAHDSVWWPEVGEKWVRERHGDAVARAATAVCTMLGGPFMIFGGGERGQEAWLARLLALRRSHPVLAGGAHTVERTEVSSADVLPIYAWLGDRWLLALINLTPKAQEVRFQVPGVESGPMHDLLNAARECERLESGASTVSLEPWGSAIVELANYG